MTACLGSSLHPNFLILIILGAVPLVFSVFFYLIPWLRHRGNRRSNEETKKENLRRKLFFHVLGSADEIKPEEIRPAGSDESPKRWQRYVRQILDRLSALRSGEIEETAQGKRIYRFPEIQRELKDVETFRRQVDLSRYQIGETVFDSGDRGG